MACQPNQLGSIVSASRETLNEGKVTTNHDLVDIAAKPDITMAVGDRHRVIVGLVAHQGLRGDPSGGLVAGIEWRRRQLRHRVQISQETLTDRLDVAAQDRGGSVYLNTIRGVPEWIVRPFQAAAGIGVARLMYA